MAPATDAARRTRALHEARFGCAATAFGHAPGRVNLIGDHVDYAGGRVLPMGLSCETHVALAHSAADDRFASEFEGDADWTRYARGVLIELRAAGIAVPPVTVAIASDVPVGAAPSSSAALEVAVARAALALAGAPLARRDVALLCQRAEHVHAGMPCGIMDQWCVAHARPGEAILLDCTSFAWRSVPLPPTLAIDIVDSGVRHALRDGGYAARRADTEQGAARLGVAQLASLPPARWSEIDALPERIARRARHVVRECARVDAAVNALDRGDLESFGALLLESHASLRDDFDVSTPELDAIVEHAVANGALGARMTGGGFGGSAIVARRVTQP